MRDARVVTQLGVWGHDRGTEAELGRKVHFLLGGTCGLRVADIPRTILLTISEHLGAGHELSLSFLIELLVGYGYYGDWRGGPNEEEELLALLYGQNLCLVAS